MSKTHAEKNSEMLRKQGLKVTPKRLGLISLLAQLKEPMSAHEIKAKWKHGDIDTVTLYRALDALVSTGIVRRVDLQHGHTDYELVMSGEHHHHLVCTSCGTIEDFIGCPEKNMEKLALKSSTRFASLGEHSLEFFGTCKTCAV
ncbi:MAG TPA: Fur family transcriptional regulator [Candidatus Paceibacterota bacterium]|nr:Fur family transcriptional regulator [Candidatus Paceibacterota bacterium]